MVFQAALNQVEKKGKSDIREELRRVYNSIDIFSCTNEGDAIKLLVDDYVDKALEKKGISRVMGKKSDLTLLTEEQIVALSKGNIDFIRNEIKEIVDSGKTKDSVKKTPNSVSDNPKHKDIEIVREVIITIIENSDVLMLVGKSLGATNISQSLDVLQKKNLTREIEIEFGVKFEIIKYLFLKGVIKQEWINLLHG